MGDDQERVRYHLVGDKSVRLDFQPPTHAEFVNTRLSLIERVRSWLAWGIRERRVMYRHEALATGVWLGWENRDRTFFATSARLIDISRGGAQLRSTVPPSDTPRVWIWIDASNASESLEATVISVMPEDQSESSVRLAFREPCPHAFLEAAVRLSREGDGGQI